MTQFSFTLGKTLLSPSVTILSHPCEGGERGGVWGGWVGEWIYGWVDRWMNKSFPTLVLFLLTYQSELNQKLHSLESTNRKSTEALNRSLDKTKDREVKWAGEFRPRHPAKGTEIRTESSLCTAHQAMCQTWGPLLLKWRDTFFF